MNLFPKIDMREVTRLTRAGKLAEAMQRLQGGGAGETAESPPVLTRLFGAGAPLRDRGAGTLKNMLGRAGRPFAPPRRSPAPPLPEGARFETHTFANAAGTRDYKVYIPSGDYVGLRPVVVMLHGCTQDADDFAAGTRMNEVAEQRGFLVVYPCQPKSANAQKCWNWFDAGQQRRDSGEPSLIAGIAREVVANFSGDLARIYVAGLSAGGAAAAIMGSTYPDVFAAVGVHSGLACGAARDMPTAFVAMSAGGPVVSRPGRPTIVFHGDADRTVNPVNATHVIASLGEDGLRETTSESETASGMGFTRTAYVDAAGVPMREQWTLHGAGHAWSGGSADGSYTDPRGPDASREMIRFFLRHKSG